MSNIPSSTSHSSKPYLSFEDKQSQRLNSDLQDCRDLLKTPFFPFPQKKQSDRPRVEHMLFQLIVTEDTQTAQKKINSLTLFFENEITFDFLDTDNTKESLDLSKKYQHLAVYSETVNSDGQQVNQWAGFRHYKRVVSAETSTSSAVVFKLFKFLSLNKYLTKSAPPLKPKTLPTQESTITPATDNAKLFSLLINSRSEYICNYDDFLEQFGNVMVQTGTEMTVKSKFIFFRQLQSLEHHHGVRFTMEKQTQFLNEPIQLINEWCTALYTVLFSKTESDESNAKLEEVAAEVLAAINDSYTNDESYEQTLAVQSSQLASTKAQHSQTKRPQIIKKTLNDTLDTGLSNRGNSCSFNSCFQAVAAAIFPKLSINYFSPSLPKETVYNLLLMACVPVVNSESDTSQTRNLIITHNLALQIADKYVQEPTKRVFLVNDQTVDIGEQLDSVQEFLTALCTLCCAINNNLETESYLNAVFKAYSKHAITNNRLTSKDLLKLKDDSDYRTASFSQECASEIIQDLMDITGLSINPSFSLVSLVKHRSYKFNKCVYHSDVQEKPTGIISVSYLGKGHSLSDYLRDYSTVETINRPPSKDHSLLYRKMNPNIQTQQTLLFSPNGTYPHNLQVSVKLFDLSIRRKLRTQTPVAVTSTHKAVSDIGVLTLCQLVDDNFNVLVPVYNLDSDQTVNIPYKVRAVICHIGTFMGAGHYVTLKIINNGHIQICDDSLVTTWTADSIKSSTWNKQKLKNLIIKHSYSGYVFLLDTPFTNQQDSRSRTVAQSESSTPTSITELTSLPTRKRRNSI